MGALVGWFLKIGKVRVLSATAAMILLIALADWAVGTRVSLGVLYVLPMMLAATVLTPLETVGLAVVCSFCRSLFDLPSPPLEVAVRFAFAVVAYIGSGWIVTALLRNRELVIEHLARLGREQDLRRQVEEQLGVLIASSPAAILTLDAVGKVMACNNAANALFQLPPGETLQGRYIARYLPLLSHALQFESGAAGLHTEAQCQGRTEAGEIFLANAWISSYTATQGPRLTAIVVDSSDELRDREEDGLRQLMRGNRIAAAAVSHEVRNLCGAIALVCSNLGAKHRLADDADFQGLQSFVGGLERIASSELHGNVNEELSTVHLKDVLDDLRIVIDPGWREIGGAVQWNLPAEMPAVLGERHGLLQAFLNLAQNSHRAVQDCERRVLTISASVEDSVATVRFQDTGGGIAEPDRLFAPFQSGADGAGLGLYVSRAVVRSYGGDLRFEPNPEGACFRVEIPCV